MRTLVLAAWLLGVVPSVALADAPAAPRAELLRVAVLDLTANGVSHELANTLTGVLANELTRLHVFSVVSNQEIRAMMTHDAMAQLAGCDGGAKCSSNIPEALGAQYLVSGSIGSIGKKYTLTFVLTDVRAGTVEGRSSESVDDPVKLLEAATRSSQALVSKVLSARQGQLLVTCSERGATVKLDGAIIGTTPLPRKSVSWGPHLLEVEKAGFVMGAEDITVQGSAVQTRHFQLSPSQDYLKIYETKAKRMRIAAWVSTGAAAAAFGTAVYFQFDHIKQSNNFNTLRTQYEGFANPTQAQFDTVASAQSAALNDIHRTYILGGVGVLLTGISLYFWLAGDEPSKYAAFKEAPVQDAPPPSKPVTWHLLDRGSLASLTW